MCKKCVERSVRLGEINTEAAFTFRQRKSLDSDVNSVKARESCGVGVSIVGSLENTLGRIVRGEECPTSLQ